MIGRLVPLLLVILAKAGGAFQQRMLVIPCLCACERRKPLDPYLRGDDGKGNKAGGWILATLLSLCFVLGATNALAQTATDAAPPQFTDTAEEKRFHALVAELRCVMCQNQSLADSNAQIARDLRREVLELMRAGKSNREIKEFLVARYGQFVLYRPQVESKTWLLWFGPALVLLAGGFIMAGAVRKRRDKSASVSDDESQEW